MSFSNSIITVIENAEAKALATARNGDLNVVPVSMIRVLPATIWLFDFFMDKTAANIKTSSRIALTTWSGLKGIQIKGTASYVMEGPLFTEAVAWVKTQNPERVLRGLIVINPESMHDISPGGAFTVTDLSLQ
jgi:predicted pyridoxine 5'-phosphate oxidase superfamily flavin-nucleotide-binding protein